MMRSVSTLARSIGAATAVSRTKGSMVRRGPPRVPHVGEPPGDRGGRGHRGAHEVRARSLALPTLEVAIGGAGHALARAVVSPFMPTHIEQPGSRHSKPASAKIPVEPLGLGRALDRARARHHPRGHHRAARPRATAAAARRSSSRLFVHEPMKTRLDRGARERGARGQPHVGQRALHAGAARGVADRGRVRGRAR